MTFSEDLRQRILVLDGAMGTMLQRGLTEEETLRMYVESGADIITTNTFASNGIGRAAEFDPGQIETAAKTARKVADSAGRKIYVAGSCGPTGKSLTLASEADDPVYREYGFDDLRAAYRNQIEAMIRGGIDLVLLETCFDALNAKALVKALDDLGNPLPLVISATVSDRSGRTLTGQTLEAFYHSVRHAPTLCAFGVNCSLGAREMAPLVREIASFSSHPLIFYPNAGLPDELGNYGDSPASMAAVMTELSREGLLNIAGGCCGTTPAHIKAIARAVKGAPARIPSASCSSLTVSGLEAFRISADRNFTNIGERTNVAGSRKFAGLIAEDNYTEALRIASNQISGGADVIDINMDDPMVDSTQKMTAFLRHISGEPDIARAAVMLDSSHWDTIIAGLKNVQGKCIVNSISLKEGEEEFLRKAREIRSLGGAMVVMAFDELGQAETYERKIVICERSYRLLTGAGIPPQDIIFDCNILSIGTGIPEHSRFGVDFIEAVRWIKANLKGALTSGGVSNLSFAFRGNNRVREAMHSAFLYHAVAAGLDMAIVNPTMLCIYDELEPALRTAVEDVIFDRDPDATSRLVAMASQISARKSSPEDTAKADGPSDPAERLCAAVVKGGSTTLEQDALACLKSSGSALQVIEGPLMKGMEQVGTLFADGRMFLPQVVKSAKVMREAVAVLQPYMEDAGQSGTRPRFLIATVQGDVHDIGKNITSVVLQCSGFEVIDLGVMVPCSTLLDKALECGADIIGVSGLITPSLARMEEICAEMASRGMRTPLFVGGAAASAVHTAVKLAPIYANVHYGADASATAVMAKKYLLDPAGFAASEAEAHSRLRALREGAVRPCSCCSPAPVFPKGSPFEDLGPLKLGAEELMPFFDWRMFNAVCGIREDGCPLKDEALRIISEKRPSALVCARFFDCSRDGDDIVCSRFRLPMLRGASCLADYLPADGIAQTGLFAARVASDADGDLVAHAVNVCLAEAASAYMLDKFGKAAGMKVIMPGIGYACCPDHSLKRDVLKQLPPEMGITLTDSCAMIPEASVCGLVIAHPDASYIDLKAVSPDVLDAYAARRNFSDSDKSLFLGHLYQK